MPTRRQAALPLVLAAILLLGFTNAFAAAEVAPTDCDGLDGLLDEACAAANDPPGAPNEVPVVWTSANDGARSGLDADFLDGLSSAHYLQAIERLRGELANLSGDDSALIEKIRREVHENVTALAQTDGLLALALADETAARTVELALVRSLLDQEVAARTVAIAAIQQELDEHVSDGSFSGTSLSVRDATTGRTARLTADALAFPNGMAIISSSAGKLGISNGVVEAEGFRAAPGGMPNCDASRRGELRVQQGGSGTADVVLMCMKSSLDTYTWRRIQDG